jgi:hypothetical protein
MEGRFQLDGGSGWAEDGCLRGDGDGVTGREARESGKDCDRAGAD